MSFGIVASVAGPIIGGMMANDAASSAADAQTQSAREANQLNRDVFNKQVELNDPYRRMGLGAGNKLMTLLGINPGKSATGIGGGTGGAVGGNDPASLRAQLLPKFTKGGTAVNNPASPLGGHMEGDQWVSDPAPAPVVDEAGLQAEIDKQTAAGGGSPDEGMGDPNDPAYGSLMKDFSAKDMGADPIYSKLAPTLDATLSRTQSDMASRGDFANSLDHRFTMADYQEDPGYAFRLAQGQQSLERGASARGGLYSGRAAKDLTNYAQGAASQEYGKAVDRFNTDRSFAADDYGNSFNRYSSARDASSGEMNNSFNRFQTNRSNKLNPLQSLMGVGQTGTGNISNAAQNYGNQAQQNITGAGNSRASSYLAQGNNNQNMVNGITSGFNRLSDVFKPDFSNLGGGAGNYNFGGGN